MLTIIMLVVAALGAFYLEVKRRNKHEITTSTNLLGKSMKVIGWVLTVTAGALFIYSAVEGGFTRSNILITSNAILFAVITFLAAKYNQTK